MFDRFLSGRIDRIGFLLGFIYYILIVVVVLVVLVFGFSVILSSIEPNASRAEIDHPIETMVILCYIITILWEFSLYVRRLHDVNRPGWIAFLGFIPFANIAFMLYLLFAPGVTDENEYGEPSCPRSFRDVTLLMKRPDLK